MAEFERCNLICSRKGIGFPQGGHHGRPGSFGKEEGTEPADVLYTALGEALEVLLIQNRTDNIEKAPCVLIIAG